MSHSDNIASPMIDTRFGIKSYEQYLIDLEQKKFSKMSMTEVMNADAMIATHGEEKYFRTCTEILQQGNEAYKQLGLDNIIHVYINTYKNFMAVANDDISDVDFLKLMKGFHEQYEIAIAQQTDIGGVSRFVLVFGDDMVNRARSAYYLNRNIQNNFIIASDEKEQLREKTEQNVKLFNLLSYAINNDKVVPFYQGIYNNQTGKIGKYEALMRVFDPEGNICPPGMFLEASKELKLYISLSKIMVDKALKDFEHKNSELSLNISLSDLESLEFRRWLINRIKRHPDPSKIIIEFVETENYNNNSTLVEFLTEARQIGCKIAVDDFGVGFATYSSIISLKPEIIKIDGDIIKNLTKNSESKIILDSICYMAKLIDSQIVAEFVENSEIHSVVEKNGIQFSQGYHFAKPQPICELEVE